MDSYNLSYSLGFEQLKRLSGLARRCRWINEWGGQELLQHAATPNSKAEIDLKLDFLEDEVARLETVDHIRAAKEQLYITDGERAACRRVADAFSEMYGVDFLILDAGRYGFVKLQFTAIPSGMRKPASSHPAGFADMVCMAFPGKLFIRLVLAAYFAVMPMRAVLL